jgi:hypothetical protein
MKRGTIAGAMLFAMSVAAGAAAEETFVGTVAIPQAGAGGAAATVPLTLVVRQYTTDERANALAQLLHDSGSDAAMAALVKEDVGQLRLGDEPPYRVTLVRQEPTGSGRVLRVVTDRPVHSARKPAGSAPPAGTVGYLELKLGAGDTGDGRLMSTVKAQFDPDGYVVPDNIGSAAWVVSGVKRQP